MKIVIALGGNALVKGKEKATIESQFRVVKQALRFIPELLKYKHSIVITFGNGFQVGNILIRVEESLGKAYALPLDVCVAESEGEIGYLIEQALYNLLHKHKIKTSVVNILTRVLVDKNDKAFRNPTKPIGPFYTKEQSKELVKKGFKVVEDAGRGYRRVVPSPIPLKILEIDVIKNLIKKNIIVIAAGGGGVPVYSENGKLNGVEAVIDKDYASQVLANNISADLLLILTGTDYIYLNYLKKNQTPIHKINIKKAQELINQGEFQDGNIKPKLQAAVNFVRKSGKKAVITSPENALKALNNKAGTHIIK
ncbi:MAG: carbamate kinase [Nanoarchaeota archaeon]